jgi:hypothetical protein
MRIDAALTPPGFIAHAKMHTLIFKNDNLYIIYTGAGPASRADYGKALNGYRLHRKSLENLAISALMKKYIKNITAFESKIADDTYEKFAEMKNSFKLSRDQISDVKTKEFHAVIQIKFSGGGKKFKFDCGIEDKEKVLKLAELIK